jgi:hypothetical protein
MSDRGNVEIIRNCEIIAQVCLQKGIDASRQLAVILEGSKKLMKETVEICRPTNL